ATKSYLLKSFGKQSAGQHHLGFGYGQNDEQEVILRYARGKTISIADWRKFWMELDIDFKLDAVRPQYPVIDSEKQDKEKDQSTSFWENPKMGY
ncbi:MAG: hypothetical protein EZS28_028543, partial [Streblomastix strix]